VKANKEKIIIFGSKGMAGHMIYKYLTLKGYSVIGVSRSNSDISCNIENFKNVEKIIIKEKIASNSFESPQNLLENIENMTKLNNKSYH
jgi:nucleoside-diphosphate-sugar epimerase